MTTIMNRHDVVAQLTEIYRAPSIVERAIQTYRITNEKDCVQAVIEAIDTSTIAEKKAVLQAQPQLGELLKTLPRLTPYQFEAFMLFNTVYHLKFNYPFIIDVEHYQLEDILSLLERRLANSVQAEFCEALAQLHAIAMRKCLHVV